MDIRALNVSEANSYIKRILINDPILDNLKVKGEISNFKIHSSGNVYFSLKDENSKINCVIFKSNFNRTIAFNNGTKVIARGYISVYERDGSYQFYVNDMKEEGIGELYFKFNKLKEKLDREGLFNFKYKLAIPKMPKNIGVITSPTGAVIRDIVNVIKRRYPKINIKLYPVTVQGSTSASEICRAIKFFNTNRNVDTVIIARGGGSLEELWPFNEEIVAREVFNSSIPIISAVGHETDFTICDFVSDLRAPTPSAAAEMATPLLEEINYKLYNILSKISKNIVNQVNFNEYKLKMTVDKINDNLQLYILKDKIIQLDKIYDKISYGIENNIFREQDMLKSKGVLLHNLSPLATINRGYSIVNDIKGNIVNSVETIDSGDELNIVVKDGNINCAVSSTDNKEG